MANLWRLDTKLGVRSSILRRDSVLLCDQFWKAVHLDFGEFDDDLSICCNDDYAFFGERSLDAFDRLCTTMRPDSGGTHEDSGYHSQRSPSTPISEGSIQCGSEGGTPVPATPIDATMNFETTGFTDDVVIQYPPRPESPKRFQSPPTIRIATPAASLIAMAASFLDKVLRLAGPPLEVKDTRKLLNQEYDVSILESDVLVQVIEGARWAGLLDTSANSEAGDSDGYRSPTISMTDTPTRDPELYNQRMVQWMLGPRADTPATSPEIDVD